jgi:ribonuclease HI
MEVNAVLDAVRTLGPSFEQIEIVSDSTYVVNCFRDQWWKGWLARGWKNSQKQPVANRDLWEPLVEEVLAHGGITFRWVKGHSGDRMNDMVDQIAVAAAKGPFDAPARVEPAPPEPAADEPPLTLF